MIQANELRIGNKVLYQGCIATVWQFNLDTVEIDSVPGDYHFKDIPLTGIYPVPITSEILQRCEGFELAKDGEHWFIGYHGWCLTFDGEDYCVKMRIDEPYVVCYIRHLHQLQNFFPFITKKELPITP